MLILHSSIPQSVRVAAIAAGLEAIGRSAGTKERSVRRAQPAALRFARILPIPSLKYRFSLLAPYAATQLTYARGVRGANNVPSLEDGGSKLDPGYLHLSCARERSPRIDAFYRRKERATSEADYLSRSTSCERYIYIYIYIGSIKRGEACFEVEFEVGREESTL